MLPREGWVGLHGHDSNPRGNKLPGLHRSSGATGLLPFFQVNCHVMWRFFILFFLFGIETPLEDRGSRGAVDALLRHKVSNLGGDVL
jgi:hypothetical protein